MSDVRITCERNDVLRVTLCRPGHINALTFDAYGTLTRVFEDAARDGAAAILLEGEGDRGFCSGGDVNRIIGELVGATDEARLRFTRSTAAVVAAMRSTTVPIVCALHGVVAGAGAALAVAADLRVAHGGTELSFLFPRVGLSGADMGLTFLLPRLVGLGRATDWLLRGRTIGVEEAVAAGLYAEVVEGTANDVRAAGLGMARALAQQPRFATGVTKRALEKAAAADLARALEGEARLQALCMGHKDFRFAYERWMMHKQKS